MDTKRQTQQGDHVVIHPFSGNNPKRGQSWTCRVLAIGPGPGQVTLCRVCDDDEERFVACRGEYSE